MGSSRCEALLDTSVVSAAYKSRLIRALLDVLSSVCTLLVSHGYLRLDVEGSKDIPAQLKKSIVEWSTSTFRDAGVLSINEESRAYGRYHRWVKKIGKMDVALAYLAASRELLLVTGDWRQLEFYATLYQRRNPKRPVKAMFIPVRWIA